jgi:GNAT superfamily N-acetyltransferase
MATVSLNIRLATPADAEALSALIFASYSRLYKGWYADDELAAAVPLMSKANPHLLGSGTYYVAELAGEIAGCGGWTETPPGGGQIVKGTAHIRHFATHPDHIRQGVARGLIERCLADAGERRVSLFKCMSSLPAERFYARLGFRRVGPADFVLPGGVRLAAIVMERDVG